MKLTTTPNSYSALKTALPQAMPLTRKDLQDFARLVFSEMEGLANQPDKTATWLKATEVRKLLKITSKTLDKLRLNGTLSFTRVGGTIYYKYEDLQKLRGS
jgi:hypothetical protein